ncbi:MAG: HD domain-containing protein [Candidatus Woesearchaeota archaeon]
MHELGFEALSKKIILFSDQFLGLNHKITYYWWGSVTGIEADFEDEKLTSEFEDFINKNYNSTKLFLRCSEMQMPSYTVLPIRYNIHNRLEHMIATAKITKEALEKIAFERELSQKEKEILILYANMHDIGHIGHELEWFFKEYYKKNHESIGLTLIKKYADMKEEDFELLEQFFKEENVLSKIISGVIGTDRIAYIK